MEDHGNNQVISFMTKVISEMSEIKGELRSLNSGLISLRDDQKRFEYQTQEALQYIMNGLKRVEGFSQYGGVDGSGKKYEGSMDNLHKKHSSCFAKGINIENKRARSAFATDFCAKREMSSGLNSNREGEAVQGEAVRRVKFTTASVIRVGISSDVKKSSKRFDKPGVFDKAGSCPKVSYKCGPYHLSKPLVDVDQAAVLEYIFDEKLDPLECIVETSRNYLNRRQMLCLKPGCWLEGEVINVIMEFLTDCERIATRNKAQTWYLNTRMNSEAMGNPLDVKDFIRRHRYQSFFMGPLVHCRKIYVPINPRKHWIVMLVGVDDEVVEIWDSYLYGSKSTGEDLVYDVLTVLDEVLKDEIGSTKPSGWSFRKFSIRYPHTVPQQPNLYDCGVFAINIMESRDISELTIGKFHSEDERARLVLKMVMSKFNMKYGPLVASAMRHHDMRSSNRNVNVLK